MKIIILLYYFDNALPPRNSKLQGRVFIFRYFLVLISVWKY